MFHISIHKLHLGIYDERDLYAHFKNIEQSLQCNDSKMEL